MNTRIPKLANGAFLMIVCVLGIVLISPYIIPEENNILLISSALIIGTFAIIIYTSNQIEKTNRELEQKMAKLNDEKRIVEKLVEHKSNIENNVSSLISLFIAPKDVDTTINETLKKVGHFCGSRCNYLILLNNDSNSFYKTHEWNPAENKTSRMMFETPGMANYPWIMKQFKNKDIFSIPNIASLPKEAFREAEIMKLRGIEALIAVPIELDQNVIGFIGIENPEFPEKCYEEQLPTLKILSELMGMSMQHKIFLDDLSLFKNLINESNDFIFILDPVNNTIIDVNETASKYLGYSREELLNMQKEDIRQIFGGLFWEEDIQEVCGNRFLDLDRTIEGKDGKIIPVEINVTFTTHENNKYALAVVRDVSTRKEMEETLSKTQERVELALAGADLGMWDWNIETNELIYNNRWAEMLGYQAKKIKPHFDSWKKLIHQDEVEEVMSEIKLHLNSEKEFFESEYRMKNIDGKWQWIQSRGKVVEWNKNNEPLRLTGTSMDTSERKQFEEELCRSNELKDLFTDIMRHDLLNPAGNVRGFADILYESEEDEKKRKFINSIRRNSNKVIEMIEAAAKFAKLESTEELELQKMDIGSISRNVIDQFEHILENRQMTIEMKAPNTYYTMANPIVEEILANYISNAIKYSPDGTNITVDIVDTNYDWKVEVTDLGEGIPDEYKEQVFDRFKRANKTGVKGTGLGLAIVKQIAVIHQGDVGVEDNPNGQGSRFWLKLKKAPDTGNPTVPHMQTVGYHECENNDRIAKIQPQ
ncbi:PAS domain-containing protein [Methanolobus sp. ZRKC3]|uniref:sensor histidine kinase n=1 Tax=Methanolobus sp. ZRKC3 TaxID=3125786 RepID=UPI00324C8364